MIDYSKIKISQAHIYLLRKKIWGVQGDGEITYRVNLLSRHFHVLEMVGVKQNYDVPVDSIIRGVRKFINFIRNNSTPGCIYSWYPVTFAVPGESYDLKDEYQLFVIRPCNVWYSPNNRTWINYAEQPLTADETVAHIHVTI
jgi:phenylpropionate dioxygenase-like ring-hydroxylating dioxygenase large terminal subunit